MDAGLLLLVATSVVIASTIIVLVIFVDGAIIGPIAIAAIITLAIFVDGFIAITLATFMIITMSIRQHFQQRKLESMRTKNIDTIVFLQAQISKKRGKLQSIRLGEYRPVSKDFAVFSLKDKNDDGLCSSFERCYFCDEALESIVLVCQHCARPNVANLQGIATIDQVIKEKLRDAKAVSE